MLSPAGGPGRKGMYVRDYLPLCIRGDKRGHVILLRANNDDAPISHL